MDEVIGMLITAIFSLLLGLIPLYVIFKDNNWNTINN